jgi:phage pi2 protein 07
LSLSKPSHIEFGKSTVKPEDLVLVKKLGYFGLNDDELIRFVGDEIVSKPKNDEVVIFKSFFRAGLRFP